MIKSPKKIFILFTCEHAENKIPREYQKYFVGKQRILNTHRGYDLGTKTIGIAFGQKFKAPVVLGKYSRLLMDLNRSADHPKAFSEMTRDLTVEEKMRIKKNIMIHIEKKLRALSKKRLLKDFLSSM